MTPLDLGGEPHVDGLRAAVASASDGATVLVLELVAGGVAVAQEAAHVAADDPAGRAEMSRVVPLCEAIASYLTFGGTAAEVAGLLAAFGRLPAPALPPGVVLVATAVEATRTHVLARPAAGDFLLVVEGESTRVLSTTEAGGYVGGSAIPGLDDVAAADDWSFLESFREEIDGDASDDSA